MLSEQADRRARARVYLQEFAVAACCAGVLCGVSAIAGVLIAGWLG